MVVFNRWVTLVAGMYMMLVSGTIYAFPGYSTSMKNNMGYDVEQINFVGTMLNTGTWASVIGGFFFDKFGPRKTSIIGSIIVLLGYFFMYLSENGTIGGNSYSMGFFAFLAGQGSGWLYTAALNTNAANFLGEDRGKILGVLTCCFGLCSGIFALIYRSFFKEVSPFLLFLAIVIPVVGIFIGSIFCNYLTGYPKSYASEKGKINIAYGIMVLVILLVCVTGLVTNFTATNSQYFCAGVFVLIALLLVIPFRTDTGLTMSPTATASVNVNETNNLIPDEDPMITYSSSERKIEDFVSVKVGRKWGRSSVSEPLDLPLWKAMMTVDFYLLFLCFFANIGAGITILNNINEIVIALVDLPLFTTIEEKVLPYGKYMATFVILFSVFNTCGRLIVGMLSDHFLPQLSRASWLIIISSFMALTQVYFIVTDIPSMFGGIFLLGISYGGTFSLLPTLTSEFFGLKNFGANFGFLGLAPAMGSELISVLLAGSLNDKYKSDYYITIISKDGSVKNCIGRVCYRYTFFVTLGLCCVSILSAVVLSYRQRKSALVRGYIPSP